MTDQDDTQTPFLQPSGHHTVTIIASDLERVQVRKNYLLQASEDGDYETCANLLQNGCDPNVVDKDSGFTALHIASKNARADILELLLENKADCNVQDKDRETPLHLAVKKDHPECSRILLHSTDLNVNLPNNTGETPLNYAAEGGMYEICKMLLDHNSEIVNSKNKKGKTPLHSAALGNQEKVLKLLLERNANSRAKDKRSFLPLHYAAEKGYHKCCEILVSNVSEGERELQLNARTKEYKTALILAAQKGYHVCCKEIKYGNIDAKDKYGNTALHYAAQGGYEITVTKFLEAGANPNLENKQGCTPILKAAQKARFDCVKILAKNGANLAQSDKDKNNVFHYVAEQNDIQTLRSLLSDSALTNIINVENRLAFTPLHLAIKQDAFDSVLLLLQKGASAVEPSENNMTPLHLAASIGSSRICVVLLSRDDVEVNKKNGSKETPLHLAAHGGFVDVCRLLINKGARVNDTDKNLRTALHVASAEGHATVVKFLSKKGNSPRAKDNADLTPLHLAALKGSLATCKILVERSQNACWDKDKKGDIPLDKAFRSISTSAHQDSHSSDNKRNDSNKITQDSFSEHDRVFKFLLETLCCKQNRERMLRIHEYMHTALDENRSIILDAIVSSYWWRAGFSGEADHKCQNFHQLIENYPNLVLKLQDNCIKTECYDFTLFEGNYYIPTEPEASTVMPCEKKFTEYSIEWKRNHPLTKMVYHHRHQALQHQLTKTWTLKKWKSSIQIIFFALLFFSVLDFIFLCMYMKNADNWIHVQEKCNLTQEVFCKMTEWIPVRDVPIDDTLIKHNGSKTQDRTNDLASRFPTCNKNVDKKFSLWVTLLVLTCITVFIELNFLLKLKRDYIQAEHIRQVCKIILVLIILVPGESCEFHYVVLDVWRWQCGVIAIMLASANIISMINQVPLFNVFLPLTETFIKSFLKVVFYIMMIVCMFTFIFHLLLKNQNAFSTLPQGIVKTVVWMLGDLAYDDTFLNSESVLYYPVIVNIYFLMFVIVVGGFIANLIISQPEDKLECYREEASFYRVANSTQLILKLEYCFSFLQKCRMDTCIAFSQKCRKIYSAEEKSDEADCAALEHSYLTKKLFLLDTNEKRLNEVQNPIEVQLDEIKNIFSQFLTQQTELREEIHHLKEKVSMYISTKRKS